VDTRRSAAEIDKLTTMMSSTYTSKYIYSDLWSLKEKQWCVSCRWDKPIRTKSRAKTCMLRRGSLLKTIKSLDKAAQMIRTSWINKTRGLSHIYLFFQDSMEKCILQIQLPKRPTSINGQ
jgi:hypothetical protein